MPENAISWKINNKIDWKLAEQEKMITDSNSIAATKGLCSGLRHKHCIWKQAIDVRSQHTPPLSAQNVITVDY